MCIPGCVLQWARFSWCVLLGIGCARLGDTRSWVRAPHQLGMCSSIRTPMCVSKLCTLGRRASMCTPPGTTERTPKSTRPLDKRIYVQKQTRISNRSTPSCSFELCAHGMRTCAGDTRALGYEMCSSVRRTLLSACCPVPRRVLHSTRS